MNSWQNEHTDALCDAFLTLRTREECYAFLQDVCTMRELLDMSQRLNVAKALSTGVPYGDVREMTGASIATISRVNRSYAVGSGGYALVISRLKEQSDD